MSTKEDSGIIGSIRLYKHAARMSKENVPLLPTEDARRRGLSTIEEVTTGLEARFASDYDPDPPPIHSDPNATDFAAADFDDGLLMSAEEIVEELQH
jgi:hypothetical protein